VGNSSIELYYSNYYRAFLSFRKEPKFEENLDINEIGLKKQFQEEVDRYNKFQSVVLRMDGKEKEIDKQKGTVTEKINSRVAINVWR